ncbi:MAG: hypothetical protein ACFB2X_13415 [Rivularia sp. (in: cyanobacteria)]
MKNCEVKKTVIKHITAAFVFSLLLGSNSSASAGSLLQQWKQGLSGSKLASYVGSVHTRTSSLTEIDFCRNGRYTYNKNAGWDAYGAAAGASNNRITGSWDVQQRGNQFFLVYATDGGEKGNFPIYLQNNGRVNIGGTAFAVQRGGARC